MTRLLFLGLIAALCVACNEQSANHDQEHNHGSEPLAYTLYSDKSEIFVEFTPLIVGSTTNFAAHFTVLGEKFTPLSEGKVTVSLLVGAKGIRQTSDSPTVPGIYRLALEPVAAGIGKLVFDIETRDFSDQIVIDSIKVYPDETTALADQHEKHTDANDITYLKEQAWKVDFATTPAKRMPISNVIRTSGQLLSAPGDERIVSANADGVVVFAGNATITGSAVNKGAKLFFITGGSATNNNVDASYSEAKTNYEKAKADFERAKELIKDRIISQKEYLQYRQSYENAQIKYNTIGKNYSSEGQSVVAPMPGFIKDVLVAEGQYVLTGTPLAVISQNKKLLLEANVSQKYFSELSKVHTANFKLINRDIVYSTDHLNGKLISYGKSASVATPFVPITFEIDNSENLVPGSVVNVYLLAGPMSEGLTIPAIAIMEEQGIYFVYVQVAGETFQRREVKLGAKDGIHVQVLEGVAEGERIVSKGAYQIKLASATGTVPAHGHEH